MNPIPLKGPRAFIGWFIYYVELSRIGTHGLPGPIWALTQLFSNRSTYGNWASREFQP